MGQGIGNPIVVPEKVNTYDDIREVVKQLRPLPNLNIPNVQSRQPMSLQIQMLALGYFLGVMIGDMSKFPKRRKQYETMSVRLQLSKRHVSNVRFGKYVVRCAALLGIKMKRIADYIRPDDRPYDAYRWDSQNSELIMWMFKSCLGMNIGKTTTYHPVNAAWLRSAPPDLQRSFLQGVADSDGFVDVNKHEAGIIADPNEFLIGDILEALKVRFRPTVSKGQATVIMSVKQAYSLPIFNPTVRSHRFVLAKALSNATRLWGPWPPWLRHEVDELISSGNSSKEVVLTILKKHGIAIRSQHLRSRTSR
jgi:hypothetical protein